MFCMCHEEIESSSPYPDQGRGVLARHERKKEIRLDKRDLGFDFVEFVS